MSASPTVDISKRVGQYVKLRDEIKRLDDEHKGKMKVFRETLEKLNGVLLAHLNTINANKVGTAEGTAYRTEMKSASLADPAAFMEFVIENAAWDLLDRKANVTNVEEFINKENCAPPGVNFSRRYVAGVQRN